MTASTDLGLRGTACTLNACRSALQHGTLLHPSVIMWHPSARDSETCPLWICWYLVGPSVPGGPVCWRHLSINLYNTREQTRSTHLGLIWIKGHRQPSHVTQPGPNSRASRCHLPGRHRDPENTRHIHQYSMGTAERSNLRLHVPLVTLKAASRIIFNHSGYTHNHSRFQCCISNIPDFFLSLKSG